MKLLGHIFTSIFTLTMIFTSAWAAETPTAGTSSANESSFAEHLAVHY